MPDIGATKAQIHNVNDELEYCKQRLESIIARCIEGIVVTDENGGIRFVNEASLALLHRKREELVGLPFRVPLTQEESKEFSIKLPDGRTQVLEMSVKETQWEGKPSWLVTLHDVSAQRQVQHEYRLLYRAVSQSPIMILITDAEGNVEFLNPKFAEVTGFSLGEIKGEKPYFLDLDRMPLEEYAQLWPAISKGDEWHGEVLGRKKNGDSYWQSLHISPVKNEDGFTVNMVVISEDVTARKRMEEDRARLASIVDSSDDAIIGKTLDGIITSWNFGAQEMYGYTADEVVGESITILAPPERFDEVPKILEKIRQGERIRHFETERVAKSGRRLTVSLTISPIIDGQNKIIGASAIARDMTGRKPAETMRQKPKSTGWFGHRRT